MKAETLFLTLGEAGEPYLDEVQKKRTPRVPTVVAACLLLALILPMLVPGTDKQPTPVLETLVWQERIYELVERSDRLDLERMDSSRVGEPVGTGRMESGGKEITLYQYIPEQGRSCEALLAVQDEQGWRYAVFCNYRTGEVTKPVPYHDSAHLLSLHGVDGPEDIASLRVDGRKSDRKNDLINALLGASHYGEELYQNKIYGGLTEEEQQKKSRSLAETCLDLRLETVSGLVFWMRYQPETGFVDWCLGHYKLG